MIGPGAPPAVAASDRSRVDGRWVGGHRAPPKGDGVSSLLSNLCQVGSAGRAGGAVSVSSGRRVRRARQPDAMAGGRGACGVRWCSPVAEGVTRADGRTRRECVGGVGERGAGVCFGEFPRRPRVMGCERVGGMGVVRKRPVRWWRYGRVMGAPVRVLHPGVSRGPGSNGQEQCEEMPEPAHFVSMPLPGGGERLRWEGSSLGRPGSRPVAPVAAKRPKNQPGSRSGDPGGAVHVAATCAFADRARHHQWISR